MPILFGYLKNAMNLEDIFQRELSEALGISIICFGGLSIAHTVLRIFLGGPKETLKNLRIFLGGIYEGPLFRGICDAPGFWRIF